MKHFLGCHCARHSVQPTSIPLLDLSGVSIISRAAATEEDPYTTEDLYRIRDSYRFLSPIHTLMTVDFNNPEVSLRLLSGLSGNQESTLAILDFFSSF